LLGQRALELIAHDAFKIAGVRREPLASGNATRAPTARARVPAVAVSFVPPPPAFARPRRAASGPFSAIRGGSRRVTRSQSGEEASLRKPVRSGRRSISESITAGSRCRCCDSVTDGLTSDGRRDSERAIRTTSR